MVAHRYPEKVTPKALPPPGAIDKIAPPHNLDVEHAFLSAILCHYSESVLDFAYLRPAEFFSERHRRLWEAIIEVASKSEPVTFVTVGICMKARGWHTLFEAGDIITFAHTGEIISKPHTYAKHIQVYAKLRELAGVVQRVNARCYVDNADPNDIFAEAERLVTEVVTSAPGRGLRRIDVDEMLRPRPAEPNYLCKGLLMAPGRVVLVAGASDSGKTLGVQSLAVSFASGAQAWGSFFVRRGKVVHLNWDQPLEDTERRYARLLAGLGLTADDVRGYLELIDDPPMTFADDAAFAELRAICRDASCVIIDALTGALGDVDENSPAVGRVLRRMGKISEQTGCVIIVIHHASKAPPSFKGRKVERDPVDTIRGSTSILGASGAAFIQSPIRKGELYSLKMGRPPTYAKRALDPFALRFEDVEQEDLVDGKLSAHGVKVSYVPPEELAKLLEKPKKEAADDSVQRAADLEARALRLLEVVKREPGISSTLLKQRAPSMHNDKFNGAIEHLVLTDRMTCRKGTKLGDRKPKEWIAT